MPIRLRIAIATAVILAMSLFILGNSIYFTMSRSLHADLDKRLDTVFDSYQRNPGRWRVAPGVIELYPGDLNSFSSSGAFIQVLDEDANVVKRSENLGDRTLPFSASILDRNTNGETVLYDASPDGQNLRIVSGRITDPFSQQLIAYVQVAEPVEPVETTLSNLRRNLILSSVMTMIALTLGAWLIGDAAMRPLARMSGTARDIGRTGDLSQRITPPRTRDEVQDLADTFNDMLARLEETFTAQRRFVADASHELRTPLTALRANADIMLRQIELGIYDRDDLTEGLTDVRDEVDRMSRLVQNLLTLARADVGWRPELEPVDLVTIARDTARIAAPLRRGQTLDVTIPPADGDDDIIEVLGSTDQLTQLILILLDNAFVYTPPTAQVTLDVRRDQSAAVVMVSDTGDGITAEHLQHLFERFYRTDDVRARASGGAGLGLAIARWIVQVHGGEITVQSTPGTGSVFTVRLPIVDGDGERTVGRGRTRTAPPVG